jgi:hypothetical protein
MMFSIADEFRADNKAGQMSEEYAGAVHECACAFRERAGIKYFGRRNLSAWDQAVDDWTKA